MGPTDPVGSPGPWEQMRNGRKAGENMDQKVLKRSEHSLVTSHTDQARWKAVVAICWLEQGKLELFGWSGLEATCCLAHVIEVGTGKGGSGWTQQTASMGNHK